MKKLLFLLIVMSSVMGWSKEEEVLPPPVEQPRVIEEAKPEGPPIIINDHLEAEYPGGIPALRKYLKENMIYPQEAKGKGLGGRCYLKFIVSAEGKVTNVKVARGVPDCPECDAEAVRVIAAMPDWKPVKLNGKPVATYFNLPVTFDPKR